MENILHKVFSFQTSQVILTAVELGIFSEVHRRAGESSATAENVTKALNLDFNATRRLLNACVGLDLLLKSNDDVYSVTADVAKYLTDDSSSTLVHFVKKMRDRYTDVAKLATAVKHGQAGVYPENMATEGQAGQHWLLYNADMIQIAGSSLVRAFDLNQYRTACDLAGGTGGMARSLKQAYPEMTVSVLEQPAVVQYAREHQNSPDSITFIAGDATSAQLPPSDLYLLSHFCMFLNDADMELVFRNIFNSLPPGGALLLCESLLNGSQTGPVLTSHRDINQLVETPNGERNSEQYASLLKRAGFQDVQTRMFDSHIFYDVIFARKI